MELGGAAVDRSVRDEVLAMVIVGIGIGQLRIVFKSISIVGIDAIIQMGLGGWMIKDQMLDWGWGVLGQSDSGLIIVVIDLEPETVSGGLSTSIANNFLTTHCANTIIVCGQGGSGGTNSRILANVLGNARSFTDSIAEIVAVNTRSHGVLAVGACATGKVQAIVLAVFGGIEHI